MWVSRWDRRSATLIRWGDAPAEPSSILVLVKQAGVLANPDACGAAIVPFTMNRSLQGLITARQEPRPTGVSGRRSATEIRAGLGAGPWPMVRKTSPAFNHTPVLPDQAGRRLAQFSGINTLRFMPYPPVSGLLKTMLSRL